MLGSCRGQKSVDYRKGFSEKLWKAHLRANRIAACRRFRLDFGNKCAASGGMQFWLAVRLRMNRQREKLVNLLEETGWPTKLRNTCITSWGRRQVALLIKNRATLWSLLRRVQPSRWLFGLSCV